MKDGDIKLLPANPDYPEILLSGEDQLNIWGVVSYAIKKFKL
jgi:SOS-response transcriptional repressor LexA